jgi:uncharacterized protein (DUF1684 family)
MELDRFSSVWHDWHRHHETVRSGPHGFLAITGLNFLTSDAQRFPDAPGEWSTGPNGVRVALATGEHLVVHGAEVHDVHEFGVIAERGGVNANFRDAVIEVAKRGGHDVVRPRHPENPRRVTYPGTPTYPPDTDWKLLGRYVRFARPLPTTVGAAVDGLQHVYDAPGRVEFELAGEHLALTAFPGYAPRSLLLLFTDLTSGVTTYAGNRCLAVDAPAADGQVWLDFNRSVNLPCAYTPFATCPLPPAENHLRVAIEAGERMPV